MYMWMDHMMSAEANGQATVYFGEAPTSQAACDYAETIAPGHCEQTHATDEAYLDDVWYWSTPAKTARTRTRPRPAWTTTPGSRRGPRLRGRVSPLFWTDPMLPGGPPPGSIILIR